MEIGELLGLLSPILDRGSIKDGSGGVWGYFEGTLGGSGGRLVGQLVERLMWQLVRQKGRKGSVFKDLGGISVVWGARASGCKVCEKVCHLGVGVGFGWDFCDMRFRRVARRELRGGEGKSGDGWG